MKYESTIANNDANNDTNGFISIDIQLIAVEIHVAITPSVRVMAQQVGLVVDNRPPMGSPHNSPLRTELPNLQ